MMKWKAFVFAGRAFTFWYISSRERERVTQSFLFQRKLCVTQFASIFQVKRIQIIAKEIQKKNQMIYFEMRFSLPLPSPSSLLKLPKLVKKTPYRLTFRQGPGDKACVKVILKYQSQLICATSGDGINTLVVDFIVQRRKDERWDKSQLV